MAAHSRTIAIIFFVLALGCLPFLLCGKTEATVGGGVSWLIILLSLSVCFFIRSGIQAKQERADRELVRELLPNEMDRREEP